MTKLSKILLPPLLSVLTIWMLLKVEAIFHARQFGHDEDVHINGDLIIFPLMTIIALFFQLILTIPIWNRFKQNKIVFGLALRPFFTLLSVIGGLIFGFLFWQQQFGINDLVISSLLGITALAIYWTINILALNKLDNRTTE